MPDPYSQPNLIFLMTDQQRWDALGCVNPVVKTPNLDVLARKGIRFSQAICNAPMCVPSRYSMMLGLHPSQCGVRHNSQFCPTDDLLPRAPLAARLQELGYQPAGIGKTHWYLGETLGKGMGIRPSRRGFEFRAQAQPLQREPDARWMAEDAPDAFARLEAENAEYGGGKENALGYRGKTSAVAVDDQYDGWLTRQALDFLDHGRDSSRPLFFYLALDYPHPGLNPPAGYEDLYSIDEIPDCPIPPGGRPFDHLGEDARNEERIDDWLKKSREERRMTTLRYYAACSFVDDMFGRTLRKLESMGELDDALIVFLSDHGDMLGDRWGRYSKYCLYEGSVRVPLILSGSRVPETRRGTVDERCAELIDVAPTLMEAGGAPAEFCLPGRSLLSPYSRMGGFAEMHGNGYEAAQRAPLYMWRTRDWKLIFHLPGDALDAELRLDQAVGELYNLKSDPYEWNNVYDDPRNRDVRERLTRELLLHLAIVWARYPYRPSARAPLDGGAGRSEHGEGASSASESVS
ncbi:MAG: sulfatase-like hydrolase/transferase [Candidatus Sumerlaeota bacterium]|nr:sulfatase-like hydrolase/transferase [Candidatus Sumerlaeota bacterium]